MPLGRKNGNPGPASCIIKSPSSRIYATAFARKDELEAYLTMLEEAKKRDHRKLGRDSGKRKALHRESLLYNLFHLTLDFFQILRGNRFFKINVIIESVSATTVSSAESSGSL